MIRLGPLGLKKGLKRIKNLIVEEISLVDNPAIRRRFLLIKRDSPEETLDSFEQGRNSMGFEELKNLKAGEEMVFEREEELALPPDVVRQLKGVIGSLSKLIGYKAKVKYKYTKPGEEEGKGTEEEQAKRELNPEEEAKKKEEEDKKKEEENKKKEEEDKEKEEEAKKKGKENVLNIPKIQDQEVSKEVADKLKELETLTANPEEIDFAEVQQKIGEIMGELKVGSGGQD